MTQTLTRHTNTPFAAAISPNSARMPWEEDYNAPSQSQGQSAQMPWDEDYGTSGRPANAPERGTPEYEARKNQLMQRQANFQKESDRLGRNISLMRPVLGAANAVNRFSDSFTLGAPTRLASTAMGLKNLTQGEPANFREEHEALQGVREDVRQKFPKSSLASDVGGTIAGFGKIAKAGGTSLKLLPQSARTAAQTGKGLKGFGASTGVLAADGAAFAGIDALIDGRDAQEESKDAAAAGVALNTVTRGAGKALSPVLKGARQKLPSADELSQMATAAYRKADELGTTYSPAQLQTLVERVKGNLPNVGPLGQLRRQTDPHTMDAVNHLSQSSKLPASVTDVDQFRRSLSGKDITGRDKHLIGRIRQSIDDFANNTLPASGGRGGQDAIKSGRDYTNRSENLSRVNRAIEQAKDNASGSLSGRLKAPEKMRSEFKNLLKSNDADYLTPEARQHIRQKIVRGTAVDSASRLGSKLAPTGFISGAGTVALGNHFGGPLGAIGLPLAGSVSKGIADKRTKDAVQDLLDMVASGSRVIPARNQNAVQKSLSDVKRQEELARQLMLMQYAAAPINSQTY